MSSEKDVILRAVNGSQQAFNKLVKRYYAEISIYLSSYNLGNQEIEDIVQEVFIRAYQKIELLKEPYDFRPWIYKIAANLANNSFKIRTIHHELTENTISTPSSPISSSDTREIIQAINNLNKTLKTATKMHLLHGLTINQIKERLQIPAGTIKRRLHDAKKYIRKEFTKMKNNSNTTTAPQIEISEVENDLLIYTDHLKSFFGQRKDLGAKNIIHEFEYPGSILSAVRVTTLNSVQSMMGKKFYDCLEVIRKENESTESAKVYIDQSDNKLAFSITMDENQLPVAGEIQTDIEYGNLQSGEILYGHTIIPVEIKFDGKTQGKCLRVTKTSERANQSNDDLKYLRNVLADFYYNQDGQIVLVRLFEQADAKSDLLPNEDDRRIDEDGTEYRLRRELIKEVV